MKEKNKSFFGKLSDRIKSTASYVKFLRVRDRVAAYVLKGLLALFNAIGPVWNFFFLETQHVKSSGIS